MVRNLKVTGSHYILQQGIISSCQPHNLKGGMWSYNVVKPQSSTNTQVEDELKLAPKYAP